VQRTKDGRTCQVLSSWLPPCVICTVHVETRSTSFLVEPQNQGRRFVSALASKPLERILRFGLKTGGDGFLVEPQNQGGGGFPGLGHKISGYGLVIWASKSVRRFLGLGLKTKQISVCRLCHKTDGRMRRRGTRVEI
jgi:hypothetical protein